LRVFTADHTRFQNSTLKNSRSTKAQRPKILRAVRLKCLNAKRQRNEPMKQMTLATEGVERYAKGTRRAAFLADMGHQPHVIAKGRHQARRPQAAVT
jgi:hypothetical protein